MGLRSSPWISNTGERHVSTNDHATIPGRRVSYGVSGKDNWSFLA
ncbi:hypothetical protein ACPOL_3965 [Acidisarcina polymorpha]|uniref:Uncharacterized protein n=1 Tax=Acidisarcina polymorpha TaxID=2211140 RepID=A0A2Z5G359_9BACT|nr:hypothetical protein ACPOL_3965 [Acidisarcina polymorpha]